MGSLRLRRSPDIATTELDGQVLLLGADSQVVLHLNEVAADVWHLLGEVDSVDEIAAVLSEAYAVPAGQVRADLDPVLGLLREHGVVLPA